MSSMHLSRVLSPVRAVLTPSDLAVRAAWDALEADVPLREAIVGVEGVRDAFRAGAA